LIFFNNYSPAEDTVENEERGEIEADKAPRPPSLPARDLVGIAAGLVLLIVLRRLLRKIVH
jgi:hypothetical protein